MRASVRASCNSGPAARPPCIRAEPKNTTVSRIFAAAGNATAAPDTPTECAAAAHPGCSEILRSGMPAAGGRQCGRSLVLVIASRVLRLFFFNSRTVFSISGSFGNAVMARSHSLASNAGEPDIRAPGAHVAADAALRIDDRAFVDRQMPARRPPARPAARSSPASCCPPGRSARR